MISTVLAGVHLRILDDALVRAFRFRLVTTAYYLSVLWEKVFLILFQKPRKNVVIIPGAVLFHLN